MSGIIYDFEVYKGKSDNNEADTDKLLIDGNVAKHSFTRTWKKIKTIRFILTFFSSINLMVKIKGEHLWSIATIHCDRLKGVKTALRQVKDLKKNVEVVLTTLEIPNRE